MNLSILTFLIRRIWGSDSKLHDALSVLISVVFRKRNLYCSTSIRFVNEGKLKCESFFFLGVFSNKINFDYSSKGCFRISSTGNVFIGDKVRMARGIKVYVNGEFSVGRNTYFNPNCLIIANQLVRIGENCAISWDTQIIDDDMHFISIEDGTRYPKSAPIIIGNNVWIGARVVILKGAIIGDGAVIGAGSLVRGIVPSNTIYAGNPAKLIRENIIWS